MIMKKKLIISQYWLIPMLGEYLRWWVRAIGSNFGTLVNKNRVIANWVCFQNCNFIFLKNQTWNSVPVPAFIVLLGVEPKSVLRFLKCSWKKK